MRIKLESEGYNIDYSGVSVLYFKPNTANYDSGYRTLALQYELPRARLFIIWQ